MKKLFLTLLFCFWASLTFAGTVVNDGSINFNGSWQTTSQVSALHASTNLNVDSGVTQYSSGWAANIANTDMGAVFYLVSVTTSSTARTMTVALEQADDVTFTLNLAVQASTTIVLNSTSNLLTWYYCKYSAAFTELATKYYRIKFTTNNAADTGVRADNAATTKVAVIQVLSATASLADDDVTYICGYATAATGNPTAATVTYNVETGAGTTGDNAHGSGNINICNSGSLIESTTASKNYYLEVAGNIDILAGGTWTRQPAATSTSTLEMNTTAAARAIYIRANATSMSWQGAPFTGNIWRTTTTDAIGATNDRTVQLADNVSTAGWAANNDIIISTTSTTAGQTEEKIISSVGTSPNSLTITTDWTNTHLSGAEVCNMSRNVMVTSSGANGFSIQNTTTTLDAVNLDWVRFYDCTAADTYGLIYSASTGSTGSTYPPSIDYCVFDTITPVDATHPIIFISPYLPVTFTYSNLCFFFNGVAASGIIFQSSSSGVATTSRNISCFVLTDSTFAKTGNSTQSMLYTTTTNTTITNTNFYDYASGTSVLYAVGFTSGIVNLDNCKIWGLRNGIAASTTISSSSTYTVGYAKINLRNCILGGDGTNTVANVTNDIYFANAFGTVNCWNTKINTEVLLPADYPGLAQEKYIASHDHGQTQYRYKVYQVYGTLTDNTTTAVTAQGGSGTCLVMNPTSSTAGKTLNWEFWIPVTAATNPQLKFYIWGSAGTPTLNIDIYDSDDDSTLLCNNESLAFGGTITDWTQKTPTFATNPTDTGWCRVVLKSLDDGSLRNIGIDTMTFTSGGTTYTYNFNEWMNALPRVFATGAAAGGAAGGRGARFINY